MSGLGMSILEEGMEKGMEKGIEKGRMEEKLASARKMLLGNMEISFIMEVTDLSEEKVEGLKKEMMESGQIKRED